MAAISFCLSADIRAAHRLVKIREANWAYLSCKSDSTSKVLWTNRVGTFGVSSPYWWARLLGLIGRFVGHVMGSRWFMQVIYVDDLHGSFTGNQKFLHLWVWLRSVHHSVTTSLKVAYFLTSWGSIFVTIFVLKREADGYATGS